MKHYAGLDVAMTKMAICVVGDQRRIVREGRAASEPEAIGAFLIATGLGTLENQRFSTNPPDGMLF